VLSLSFTFTISLSFFSFSLLCALSLFFSLSFVLSTSFSLLHLVLFLFLRCTFHHFTWAAWKIIVQMHYTFRFIVPCASTSVADFYLFEATISGSHVTFRTAALLIVHREMDLQL
jgi:hypothetical protein